MAKVKSVNSSAFYANNSSFPELKIGLGITDDCPKCDFEFDISSLLCDNEIRIENQYTDNDKWNEKKTDYEEPLSLLKKTEDPKYSSLGALAENHFKENKMWPELKFDGDFSLSDLLSNDNCPSANNSRNNTSGENDNLLDLCLLTEDSNPNVEKSTSDKTDVSFDDLSNWMNSSIAQTSDSSNFFQEHNLSCDDTDLLPDIDLTFCVKKHCKSNSPFYGNSPETTDSGFDESDFIPDKLPDPSQEKLFKENLLSQFNNNSSNKNKTSKVKQSLFCKAISAKSKIDDSRKSKLQNVMNELLKGSIPCLQQRDLKKSQKVVDHSNDNVITSSYLKFLDEK